MLEAIEKMMLDYDLKIEDCDKMIRHQRKAITICRRSNEDCEELRKERAIKQAKRQCYVQAKYDFDSLIDSIDKET